MYDPSIPVYNDLMAEFEDGLEDIYLDALSSHHENAGEGPFLEVEAPGQDRNISAHHGDAPVARPVDTTYVMQRSSTHSESSLAEWEAQQQQRQPHPAGENPPRPPQEGDIHAGSQPQRHGHPGGEGNGVAGPDRRGVDETPGDHSSATSTTGTGKSRSTNSGPVQPIPVPAVDTTSSSRGGNGVVGHSHRSARRRRPPIPVEEQFVCDCGCSGKEAPRPRNRNRPRSSSPGGTGKHLSGGGKHTAENGVTKKRPPSVVPSSSSSSSTASHREGGSCLVL